MRQYFDTSALVPLHMPERTSDSVLALLSGDRDSLLVSDLAIAEFSSALAGHIRLRVLLDHQAELIFENFERRTLTMFQRLEITPADIRKAGLMVRPASPKLLVPDAIHIAICLRLGLTLVSSDRDQLTAARFHGAEVIEPLAA